MRHPITPQSGRTRPEFLETSSAAKPGKVGLGEKVAFAGTVLRLVKRYPVAALAAAAIGVAIYLGRRAS
jgi:hypothetical protein